MQISRREFMKIAATAAASMGVSQIAIERLTEQLALAGTVGTKPKVLWLHGQNCTGCSTSFVGLLNRAVSHTAVSKRIGWSVEGSTVYNDNNDLVTTADTMRRVYQDAFDPAGLGGSSAFEDVLFDVIDLNFHPTLMGCAGQEAIDALDTFYPGGANASGYVLVIEGSIPVPASGKIGEEACGMGYCKQADGTATRIPNGTLTIKSALDNLKGNAAAIIALGTCASFGGIPAANGCRTGAASVATAAPDVYLTPGDSGNKVVNVPGCPVNPDWFYLTVAQFISNSATLLSASTLDSDHRPTQLLGQQLYYMPVHSGNCINYQAYCAGDYATSLGQSDKCLLMLGCQGPGTKSACSKIGTDGAPLRNQAPKWNDVNDASSGSKSRAGACINANAPCAGCTEKGFPDKFSPFINY